MKVEEIKTTISALDKASETRNTSLVFDILERVKLEVDPSESLLRETKLGIAIGKLRSYSDPKVSDYAKALVKQWRAKVNSKKEAAVSQKVNSVSVADSTSKEGNTQNETTRDAKSDAIRADFTESKTRNSCIVLLYNALASDSKVESLKIIEKAKTIEAFVLDNSNGQADQTYKTKLRSLYLNLKDRKNPGLRHKLIEGDLSVERLCTMSPQEMASDELKKDIKRLEDQNLFNARGAKPQKAVTDLFQCGKCKQKKVSYYQMQTRSADEPMTTFCECIVCDNRWKFS